MYIYIVDWGKFGVRTECQKLRGQLREGAPWGQIVENEFEYLVDRGGHGGHLAERFLKKYCS